MQVAREQKACSPVCPFWERTLSYQALRVALIALNTERTEASIMTARKAII